MNVNTWSWSHAHIILSLFVACIQGKWLARGLRSQTDREREGEREREREGCYFSGCGRNSGLEKIRKAFSGLAKFANGLFRLDEILIPVGPFWWSLPRFHSVNRDFSTVCGKNLNYEVDDKFQPMTVKRESITVSPQAQYGHCASGCLIYHSVGFDEVVGHRFSVWSKSTHDMTVKMLRLEKCDAAS